MPEFGISQYNTLNVQLPKFQSGDKSTRND